MKFLKLGLFFGLLFTQCFGMEFFFDKSKEYIITSILDQLAEKDAAQTLQPAEFWDMMEQNTIMSEDHEGKSCFFAEFFAKAKEYEICRVIRYLIIFGQEDKNKFYECITMYTGSNGITPMNELIRRIKSENSLLYEFFLQLLELIKTLGRRREVNILTQRELHEIAYEYWYGTEDPILTAQRENKIYIVNKIADIVFIDIDSEPKGADQSMSDDSDSGSQTSDGSPSDSGNGAISSWNDRRTKSQP